jgi:hypothetical protein
MSSYVKIARASTLDINTGSHELIVFKDDDNRIRLIVLSDKVLPSHSEKINIVFRYNTTQEIRAAGFEWKNATGEFCIVGEIDDSGVVIKFHNLGKRRVLISSPASTSWPRILHIYTSKTAILAMDDLPTTGAQPVVCDITSHVWKDDPLNSFRANVLSKLVHGQILLVVTTDHECVAVHEAIVTQYTDTETKHISIPFVQRWTCVMKEDRLFDWRSWHNDAVPSYPRFRLPQYNFIKINDASELPATTPDVKWDLDPLTVYYYTDDSQCIKVWSWRDLMNRESHSSDLLRTIVHKIEDDSLCFGGFERRYPMGSNGNDTATWFYLDLVVAGGVSDSKLKDLTTNVWRTCLNAEQIARNAHAYVQHEFKYTDIAQVEKRVRI